MANRLVPYSSVITGDVSLAGDGFDNTVIQNGDLTEPRLTTLFRWRKAVTTATRTSKPDVIAAIR